MRPSKRGSLRATLTGSALGVAAIALVMILTPFSQAAPVAFGTVVYHAPYAGKPVTGSFMQSVDCKVSGSYPKMPAFNRATGLEQVSVKSSARSCPSGLGYGWEDTTGSAGDWTPSFHGISGAYHVVVKWKVTWSATLKANLGPHFTGAAHSTLYLVGILYLYDGTNLTYLPATSTWSAFNATYNGTATFHSSVVATMYLNQTVILGHTYNIATWIDVSSYAYASSFGPSSASASVNVGTLGNGAQLLSITRS